MSDLRAVKGSRKCVLLRSEGRELRLVPVAEEHFRLSVDLIVQRVALSLGRRAVVGPALVDDHVPR